MKGCLSLAFYQLESNALGHQNLALSINCRQFRLDIYFHSAKNIYYFYLTVPSSLKHENLLQAFT